jgi:hypothetical protein
MFSAKKMQNVFILVVWAAAVTFLALDLLHIMYPTRIMHLCFLLVSVSLPMLIITLEIKIRQIKDNEFFSKDRTVIFSDDGIDYYTDSKKKDGHDSWDEIKQLSESKNFFIIYKDDNHSIPVLITGVEGNVINDLRGDLKEKLGSRYNHI